MRVCWRSVPAAIFHSPARLAGRGENDFRLRCSAVGADQCTLMYKYILFFLLVLCVAFLLLVVSGFFYTLCAGSFIIDALTALVDQKNSKNHLVLLLLLQVKFRVSRSFWGFLSFPFLFIISLFPYRDMHSLLFPPTFAVQWWRCCHLLVLLYRS